MKKLFTFLMVALLTLSMGYAQEPDDSKIALPWSESFTGTTFPPAGWERHTLGYAYTTFERQSGYGYYSAPGCVYHSANPYVSARNNWLITPQLDLPTNGTYTLKFWTKFESTYAYEKCAVLISTASNDPASGDFTELKTWTKSEVEGLYDWTECTVSLNSYLGEQIYIAFRYVANSNQGGSYWYLDDVKVSEPPVNELGAVAISGPASVPTGKTVNYNVTVENFGAASQTTYNVKLMKEDGTVLQSVPGVAIAFGEKKTVSLSWTPTVVETVNIYGEVELVGDQDPYNNQTENLQVMVYGNITLPYTMGFEDSELWQIWSIENNQAGASWARSSEYQDYQAFAGSYSMVHNPSYIGASDSWLFTPALPLDGTKAYKISFYAKNAYSYSNNQKIALYLASDASSEAIIGQPLYINNDFTEITYTQLAGFVAGLNGNYYFAIHNFSNTAVSSMFLDEFKVEETTSVGGTVTNNTTTNPVEGVMIEIPGKAQKVYTDATGAYVYALDQLGTYVFKASKAGYLDQTKTIYVSSFGQAIDFALTPRTTYTLSGLVNGNEGGLLANVAITLSGYGEPVTVYTDNNGSYSMSVYDGVDYLLTATLLGRQPFTKEITIDGANYIQNITLSENCYPVPSVTVSAPNATTPNAVVTWTAPIPGKAHLGYNVYRLVKGAPETEWTQLQTNMPTLTYTDNNAWNALPSGYYQYAIKAVYTGGVTSIPVLSNEMQIRLTTSFTVNITTNDGKPATGANVKLVSVNGQYQYTKASEATGISFSDIWKASYNLTIEFAGYQTYLAGSLNLNDDNPPAHNATLVEVTHAVPNTVFAEPNEALTAVIITWEAKEGKAFTGYNVYRAIVGETTSVLVAANTTALTYTDPATNLVNGTDYKWEVRTAYTGNVESAARWSNTIKWGEISTVYLNVSTNGNDPVSGAQVTLINTANATDTYTQIINENDVMFKGVCKGTYDLTVVLENYQTYTATVTIADNFTTLAPVVLIEVYETPSNLELTETSACEHSFSWNNVYFATVTVTVGNPFNDGTGFQMLLDETATAYGIFKAGYVGSCSANPNFFDPFSHTVPEGAYLSCSNTPTSNWVANRTVTVQIPSGVYDFCFLYSRYSSLYVSGDSYACADGLQDDFLFEAGKTYTFTNNTMSYYDNFCLTVEGGKSSSKEQKSFLGYAIYLDGVFVAMTTSLEYVFTDVPAGVHTAGVQGVYTSGVTEMVTYEFTSACTASLPTYTIQANSNNTLWGAVTGGNTYTKYQTVTLTATPAEDHEFVNWTENGVEVSTANPFEFAAMANRNLVGNFRVLVVYYIINATSNNNAWGTVSGGGKFEENLPVMLTATAKPGFEFENWTENGAVVSTTNPYTFTAAANRTVVGNFKKLEYTIEATSNNVNWGKVTGGGIFNPDAQVTLKATPEEGYEFINWTENGNPVTVENPYIFTATANRKLVGNFAEIIPESYTVTFTVKNAKTQEEIQNASITLNGVTQTGNYQFLHVTPGTYIYIVTAENYKNGSGSVAVFEDKTETVELEPLQSINDNVLSSVALYPNPFGNEINITNPEVVKSVEITTATGLKVKEVTFDGKTISTGSLSTGIYFITIESITGSKAVHKMVKK